MSSARRRGEQGGSAPPIRACRAGPDAPARACSVFWIAWPLLAALTLTACGDAPDRTYAGVAGATHDCGKERKVAVNASVGIFTFIGTCERVSLNGANNTLTIEAATALDVKGDSNTVRIGAVDAVSVSGSRNNVRYRSGVTSSQRDQPPRATTITTSFRGSDAGERTSGFRCGPIVRQGRWSDHAHLASVRVAKRHDVMLWNTPSRRISA
jgi:hypothetical protein